MGSPHCNDLLVIRSQTILALDTFINVPVDELNKLKDKQVNNVLVDEIGGIIPESEDDFNENYSKELKTLRNAKLSGIDYVLIHEVSN